MRILETREEVAVGESSENTRSTVILAEKKKSKAVSTKTGVYIYIFVKESLLAEKKFSKLNLEFLYVSRLS